MIHMCLKETYGFFFNAHYLTLINHVSLFDWNSLFVSHFISTLLERDLESTN